jgi:hypothetical protein
LRPVILRPIIHFEALQGSLEQSIPQLDEYSYAFGGAFSSEHLYICAGCRIEGVGFVLIEVAFVDLVDQVDAEFFQCALDRFWKAVSNCIIDMDRRRLTVIDQGLGERFTALPNILFVGIADCLRAFLQHLL